jgi:hypothetical protein
MVNAELGRMWNAEAMTYFNTSKEVKWTEEIEKQPVQIPSKSGPREC